MVHSDVPLGILPAGTANVLANETGMSTSLEKAARGSALAVRSVSPWAACTRSVPPARAIFS